MPRSASAWACCSASRRPPSRSPSTTPAGPRSDRPAATPAAGPISKCASARLVIQRQRPLQIVQRKLPHLHPRGSRADLQRPFQNRAPKASSPAAAASRSAAARQTPDYLCRAPSRSPSRACRSLRSGRASPSAVTLSCVALSRSASPSFPGSTGVGFFDFASSALSSTSVSVVVLCLRHRFQHLVQLSGLFVGFVFGSRHRLRSDAGRLLRSRPLPRRTLRRRPAWGTQRNEQAQ